MGQLLLFLWLCLICVLFATGTAAIIQARTAERPAPLFGLLIAIALGAPPVATFVVTVNFLLRSHPTHQFIGDDPVAGQWWSFWVHWWPAIYFMSTAQILLYVVVIVTCGMVRQWRFVRRGRGGF